MELGYFSPIFLREKKENKYNLILSLKELIKLVPHHHFNMDTLKFALNMTRKGCYQLTLLMHIIVFQLKFSPEFLWVPISGKILQICMVT